MQVERGERKETKKKYIDNDSNDQLEHPPSFLPFTVPRSVPYWGSKRCELSIVRPLPVQGMYYDDDDDVFDLQQQRRLLIAIAACTCCLCMAVDYKVQIYTLKIVG